MGKVCLVGCEDLVIDLARRRVRFAGTDLVEGETLTPDGNQGLIYRGRVHTVCEAPRALLQRFSALRAG